ncbi:cyclic nucleotide-binding domain-containing protein [Ensifer sp. MPMI2T]|nr:cyclic nucleotide-binding domain-containing protein [Ensifer sp. MPMI2T]
MGASDNVVQIAFFLVMTAIMIGNGISPVKFEAIQEVGGTLVAAKVLWWVHLAWSTIGFIRIYIVLDGRPIEARLLQDLFVAVVYLGVTLSILSFVFGIAIGTLVAAVGLSLAPPTTAAVVMENALTRPGSAETVKDLLRASPVFADLKPEELEKLETAARTGEYRTGDRVLGGAETSLMIVRSGVVAAHHNGAEVTRLPPGAIFGQVDGIDGKAITFEALTEVEAFEIDSPAIEPMLQEYPAIQNDLSRHLAGLAGRAPGNGSAEGRHPSALLRKVHGILGR